MYGVLELQLRRGQGKAGQEYGVHVAGMIGPLEPHTASQPETSHVHIDPLKLL